MQIDWWTLGLQTVNVLVLVWLLKRFLFQPVSAIIEARQAAAAALLDEARTAKAEAEAERDKAAQEAARLAGARSETLTAATAEAEAARAALLAAAHAEADRQRAAVTADIARTRQDEVVANADRANLLAVDIATKLLGRLPEEAQVAAFIDGLATALAGLSDEIRAGIGAGGAAIHIRSARALNEAETRTLRTRLAEVLGRPVDIAIEADPGLIAGFEIDAPHAVIRNSFRADLDRIASELTRHDHAGQ